MRRALPFAVISSLVVLVGCGGVRATMTPPDAGSGLDAASEAGPLPDGGVADLGTADANATDAGVDAGPMPCASAGTTENVACGMCGTVSRFCSADLVWVYGACTGEGACVPGATRMGTCGNCGMETEQCSATCAWAPTGACMGEGACTPGASSRSGMGCPAGQTRAVTCDATCAFAPSGMCEADSCPTPGVSEPAACGMCGTTTRFCNASHVWDYGTCSGEGVCAPGSTQMVACGMCGMETAHCTTACAWDTTGSTCGGEGVCTPGAVTRTAMGCPAGQTRALTCNATCSYDMGDCAIDECVPGATMPASCGMCGTLTRTCSPMRTWVDGACGGEGVCMPGTTGTAGCGHCGTQATMCNTMCASVPAGACTGEGPCAAGSVTSCPTTCGSTGTMTCSPTCTAGACVPPAEVCNGVDDDCDGVIDNGCTTCSACPGSTAVTGTGGRYTVTLGAGTRTGTCGGAGAEALLSVTLTVTSDVFVSTHGDAVDTVLYARRCNCSGSEIACVNDSDGRVTSALHLDALAPGTYTIVVDSASAATGTVLSVDAYVSPTGTRGDRCGNPLPIAPGTTVLTGNTCGLGADYDTAGAGTCTLGPAGDAEDAVYYFVVPTTSTVTFNGCNEGYSYDGVLYVRSACNGAALSGELTCDDDSCGPGVGTCTSLGYGPSASVTLSPGLYYLFVDGYVMTGTPTCAQCGPFDLTVTGV